ncbi:MAG TPA: adenylate/guanylate cyclase domain-containing protein, partial [Candidatus Methylomirabilis sp.]
RAMGGKGEGARDRLRGVWQWVCNRSQIIPGASAAVLAILFFLQPGFIRTLDFKLLDEHFRLRGARAPVVPIRIVAIDDASLEKLGRWPWPRATLAKLFKQLADAKPRVVGVDVILSEPEVSPEQSVADHLLSRYQALGVPAAGKPAQAFERELMDLRQRGDPDRTLAAEMERTPQVIAAYFSFERATEPGPPLRTPLDKFGFIRLRGREDRTLLLLTASKVTEPIPILAAASRLLGHVNILPDPDGTIRRETLAIGYRENFYPSLGLQVARLAMGVPADQMLLDLRGEVRVGPVTVPTDVEGRMLINFVGKGKTFPHYSAADVLSGAVPPETFKDAIVFVGATAAGIFDLRVTPYEEVFPGVEIHANTVENILGRRFLHRPAWVEIAVFLLILVLPFGLGCALRRLRPLAGGFLAFGLLLGLFVAGQVLFAAGGVWLPVLYPMLAVVLTHVPITVHRALSEERQRLFVKRAFQQYVPEGVVKNMIANPALLRFGGDRKELTILFSDVRGFTTYSERHDAEKVVEILGEYLTRMVDVVFKNEGTLDKFIGDAVMAIFGAPVPQTDHALRACKTAVGMMAELKALRQKWAQEGRDPFAI